jgi:SAM-dependent methyltransferase
MNDRNPQNPSLIQRIFPWKKPKSAPDSNVLKACGYCFVCGGSDFSSTEVLWQELIDDWGISPEETAYINRQQGTTCCGCHNNLRSIALAKAILVKYGFPGTLREFFVSPPGGGLRVLSINTSGGLSTTLETLVNYQLAEYPEHNMTKLGFADGSFDLVIHSDTLEHVPDPVLGLKECKRILADGGSCIFTIPIIVGRLSADRKDRKVSYHGSSGNSSDDWAVQTEYGADAWMDGFKAGFSNVKLHCLEYPAAFAIECNKSI